VGVVGVVGVIWRPRHMQGAKIMQEVAGAVAMVRGPGGGWRCEDVVEGWAGNGVCVPEVGARGGLYDYGVRVVVCVEGLRRLLSKERCLVPRRPAKVVAWQKGSGEE
jgi:hypothetical protein